MNDPTGLVQQHAAERTSPVELVQLLAQALEGTAEGVLIADSRAPGYPIVYANRGVAAITGYPVEAFLGRSCSFLQGDRTDQPGLVALRRALAAHEPVRVVLQNQRRDGSWFWNQLSITPFADEEGITSHFLGVQRDVTAEIEAREREEVHRQLLAIESRSASILHDINNLLAILDLGLREVEDHTSEPKVLEQVQQLIDVVGSGTQIARRALGRDGVERPQTCDVVDLLRQRRRLLERVVSARGQARLILDLPDAPILLDVEPSGLEQMLLNLLGNAADALEGQAQGVVEIRVYREAEQQVLIEVIDDGPGVPPDVQQTIFEPLFSSKGERGTGLGLPTVCSLVGQMGGGLTLRSRPGQTVFTVRLPCRPPHVAAARSILYVEDEALLARLVVGHLARGGHQVRQVGTIREAELALIARVPDVLLLDDELPDGRGLDLGRAAQRRHPGLAIVLATGLEGLDVPDHWVVVPKPFGLLGIDEAIHRACAAR